MIGDTLISRYPGSFSEGTHRVGCACMRVYMRACVCIAFIKKERKKAYECKEFSRFNTKIKIAKNDHDLTALIYR